MGTLGDESSRYCDSSPNGGDDVGDGEEYGDE